MSKPRFTSRKHQFLKQNSAFIDILQGHMAMDIEVGIKSTAGTPVKTGDMKAEVRHFRSPTGGFRVESEKEYSAVQEKGMRMTGPGAPTRKFTNYTTAGTGAGWFRRAIDAVWKNRDNYVEVARKAVGL